ncbi:MAG: 3-dehydroquinate synthase II [Phycisphaerae bacterium]|nr:3-dehydroquinate synthase II [Phycisphaerae bacterium]
MKRLWVKIDPYDKPLAIAALESGAQAVVLPPGCSEKIKQLGRITTVAPDGDLKPDQDVCFLEIRSKADEISAAKLPADKPLVLKMADWTIIPLENLIAQRDNLIAQISDASQARAVLGALEKGVDGILLDTRDINQIKKAAEIVQGSSPKVELAEATITGIESLGMGDRVCVDTCSNMSVGEGMLIGNTATGFLLVHSESVENPYVAARPFRVNAGAVHAYTLLPGGKTAYLSDLRAGQEVLLVDHTGSTRSAYVGRVKVERRPLMLIRAELDGKDTSLVLQNAETIRLTSSKGQPLSVAKLKVGDKVLAHTESSGRHFGMKVEETLIEK